MSKTLAVTIIAVVFLITMTVSVITDRKESVTVYEDGTAVFTLKDGQEVKTCLPGNSCEKN